MSAASRVLPVSNDDYQVRRGFKVGEVAWLLGLSYDVTLRLITSGELGARRVGKYLVVAKPEIDRFVSADRGAA